MSTTVRKQAPRPARPVGRYWKGKAPKGANINVDSESEEDEELQQKDVLEDGDVAIKALGDGEDEARSSEEEEEEGMMITKRQEVKKVGVSVKTMNVALKDVNISKDGKVIVAGREESGRTLIEAVEESEEEEEEEESEEEAKPGAKAESEEESSEYESSSEEEEKPKVQFRPVFVPKRARATIAERDAIAQDTEEALKKKEEEAEARKKQSHDMVAESIKRELAENEKEENFADVDDTDGLDPEGEFEAWRLRELARIKRDKEAELEREREREEIERRRAMPEEQRLKEDMENAQKTRDEKPKGKQKFLQKYWHKGAFHQDYEILKRDYTEATESTMDVSLLPKVMQVKNFGKRSRTKYTHLVDQDTTVGNGGFGGVGSVRQGGTGLVDGGSGCFLCGGPHLKKDCPQNTATGPLTARGANAQGAQTQTKQWGAPPKEASSWRDRDDRGPRGGEGGRDRDRGDRDRYNDRERDRGYYRDKYRDRGYDRDRNRSRSPPGRRRGRYDEYDRRGSRRRSTSRSRSRSPRRRADGYRKERRRSREISVDEEHKDRDKRRRVD
ncbi:hypothetical protein AX16_000538 [Volvariella volvacea WC 439]|nr:hypothetical protein AX16_000538 [Volvariella volvacea WC 439]